MIPTTHQSAQSLFKLALVVAGLGMAWAQDPADFQTSVRAAMAPSIDKQRSSVKKQAGFVARPAGPAGAQSFFVLPIASNGIPGMDCEPLPRETLDAVIDRAALKEGVDSDLVHAVIEKESGARPCAVSSAGALGLMQLMPATADEMEVQDPFDAEQNVEAGTKLLRSLLDRYDDNLPLSLGAYNAGASRVDEAGGVPQIPETLKYVADIIRKLNRPSEKTNAIQPVIDGPYEPLVRGTYTRSAEARTD